MVTLSVKVPGKPSVQVEFPGKTAEQVTVLDLKKAVRARGIKVCSKKLMATISVKAALTGFHADL